MSPMPRRRKGGYFPENPGEPAPVVVRLQTRIHFSDVDPMGVLWHGRYAKLFEAVNEEIGRRCGICYADFYRERLRAPIVQLHVDYFASPVLAEVVTTTGRLLWSNGARMNIEYEVHKESGQLAATGYTVQMFMDEAGAAILAPPPLQQRYRERWLAGEFGEIH